MLLQKDDFNKLKNKVNESAEPIIFTSDDDEFNRKVLEKLKINILLINQKSRKDFQKQRNSGFNQVLAKVTKKNNIQIGINLDEMIESNQKEKSKILARVHQNVNLCNKNKIQMQFIGKEKRNLHDLKSLGLILGMPTWMTKLLKSDKIKK
jgi:RNase P/RNase MRP subunit p30